MKPSLYPGARPLSCNIHLLAHLQAERGDLQPLREGGTRLIVVPSLPYLVYAGFGVKRFLILPTIVHIEV